MNLFRRLLGQSAPPPHLAGPLADLGKLARERPALAAPASLLSEILPALFGAPVCEPPPVLTDEQAAAKLDGGISLLRGEAASLDAKAFGRRWQAVCDAVGRHQGDGGPPALAAALRTGKLVPAELLREVLAGRPAEIHAKAEALGVHASLTATALRLTLMPVFVHWAAALAPLRAGSSWDRGHCPTCGSWPLLGEFRGLEQVRFLRCGLCASEWEFARLRCPFCDTRDHRRLGYFHAEGEEASRRAATCDECRGYVKVVATLAPLSPAGLLVADVATLDLDLAAAGRGYAAPA